jgi:genome maintenance exonuclease 1|tara:strand:- start:198 stop:860 length:663 start_codon:yes stop_codon:yes gene_type:complete
MKIFNHLDLPELPKLSRKNIDGKRMYCTDSGDRFPSITTVLSCRGKKGLYEWRQRVGSEQADKISKKASTRGTKIHKICEDYINNEPLPELTLVEQETWNTFRPVVERIDNIHHVEPFMFSKHLGIAGQCDCIAEFDGKLSIIDFKTSRRVKTHKQISSYFAQCAAYAIMYEELTGIPINRTVILMSVDDEQPSIFIEKRDNYVDYLLESKRMFEAGEID